MNILFITDEYLPFPSSNGACVSRLAKEMEEEDKVHVLSITRAERQNTDFVTYCHCVRKESSYFNRLFGFCQDDHIVDIAAKAAEEVIINNKVSKVVCVYRPVETLLVGQRLKRRFPDIKIVAYFLDNAYEHTLNNPIKTKILHTNQIRLLKKIEHLYDGIIVLKYYRDTFQKHLSHSRKLLFVGLPSLLSKSKNSKVCNGKKIVYTGSLCKEFRDPRYILEFLSDVAVRMPDLSLHMFSVGCEETLQVFKEKMGDQLQLHGFVSLEEAQHQIRNADILLNIGNDLPFAVPGKLMEYISTGKPIVCFQFREDDPANTEYEKYPSIFRVFRNKDNDLEAFTKFVQQEKKPVDSVLLETLFFDSLPQYTVKVLRTL